MRVMVGVQAGRSVARPVRAQARCVLSRRRARTREYAARMQRILVAAIAAFCVAYLVALSACSALAHHTAEPYRSDAAAAAAIEREAAAWCSERGRPGGAPTLPFRFDGCSLFPDGDWRDCCQTHDYAYWCGGSAADRSAADERLRACVARARPALGRTMWLGVRVGGHPVVPTYFRWGYGHAYSGCYPDASPAAESR